MQKYGYLTLVKRVGPSKAIFTCECGSEKEFFYFNVVYGKTKSCGCYHRKVTSGKNNTNYIHGLGHTRINNIFTGIKTRCENKNCFAYKEYGGRGIKCLWDSFIDFKKDMYRSYLAHVKKHGEKNTTIDRIDNNGNYCKENCRWSTRKEQSSNKRNSHLITFKGKTKTMKQWAEEYGINYQRLAARINRDKWDIERALTNDIKK